MTLKTAAAAAVVAGIASIACSTPAFAQAAPSSSPLGLSLTTGIDYSSGDYGANAKTNIIVVPLNARLNTGNLRLSATLPYLRIKGPGSVIGGGEGGPIVVDPDVDLPVTKRSGLGDLSLSATYGLLRQNNAGFDLDLTGRVKVPTANKSEGLGTGKTDVGVSAEVARTFGNATPFASVGYRMPGDPNGIDLRNSATASVGSSFTAGSTVLIASYDYAGKTSQNAFASHSLFGAVSGPLNERLNVTGYGTAGLSRGAPDYGAGVLLSFKAF